MRQRLLLSVVLVAVLGLPAAQAQIFGPSDEEKARESAQDSGIQRNGQDINQLQSQLRDLSDQVRSLTQGLARATGANEELGHRLDLLNDKLDRAQKDFAYRLCTLSAQQLGADNDPAGGLNCAAAGTQSAPRLSSTPPQGMAPGAPIAPLGSDDPVPRGRPPGVLGTLSGSGPGGGYAPAPATPVPGANAGQFDVAMNLLAKAQYDEAKAGFRAYADGNPDDSDLSPQAIYWIGDIDYVRRDYPNAARDFAELIKKYPTSTRAADGMLKLGQALLAMGQKSEGCTTLGALKSKFPNASAGTVTAAQGARRAACT